METPGTNSVSLYRRTTDSSSTEDDSEGEDESSWKRQSTNKAKKMLAEGGYDFSNSSTAVQPQESFTFGKKKVNNVWGAVLNEQLLAEDLGQFSVASEKVAWAHDRQCESYDFTRKALDTRPDPEEPDDLFENDSHIEDVVDIQDSNPRGTKRSIRDRLGERPSHRPSRSRNPKSKGSRSRGSSSSKSESPDAMEEDEAVTSEVASDIAKRLEEPKKALLERVVKVLGSKRALRFLAMTEDIEEAGGLMTRDKSRRRTPGGVFFYVLKAHTSKDQVQLIFEEEAREQELVRRRIRKERNKKLMERHAEQAAAAMTTTEPAPEAQDLEDGEIVD